MSSTPINRRLRRRTVLSTSAAVLALAALSGCGGNDAEANDGGSTSGGLTAVKIQRSPGGSFEAVVLADKLGYFKDAGLKVTIETNAGNPSAAVPLLLNDEFQFAMIDGSSVVRAVDQKLPLTMVAGILSAEPGNPQQDGIVVPPGSEIDSADDLAGATVGINSLGGNTQVAANTAIEAAGGDVSSVKYVQLPPDTLVNAATSGKVDAVVTFGNFFATALQAGFTPVSKGALDLPHAPSVVWAASTKYIAEKPDVAKAFVGAIEKANDYANTHPAEVRSVDTELTKLPAAYIKSRKIAAFTTAIDLEGTQALSDAMKDQGFTKSAPAAKDLVWADAPTS